jgi:hypothetical protein
MKGGQLSESGTLVMNEPSELWSTPWHARLKNLADTLRLESAEDARAALRVTRMQSAATPPGSWLRRAHRRAMLIAQSAP